MDLRARFSHEERLQFVRERWKAGIVVKLHCDFTDPPKPKRMLIVAANRERPLLFIINSEPTEFAKANKRLIAQHLLLEKATENFLDHDSYLDCSTAYDNFDKIEIEDALVKDTTLILGDLSAAAAEKVLDIITDDSPYLSPLHVNEISAEVSKLF
jgi:hypothetical protein